MILTTTHIIEGRPIKEYVDIISCARVYGMAGSHSHANAGWQRAIEDLNSDIVEAASGCGADAVVGISYFPVGSYICATGTAVTLQEVTDG